MTKNPERSEVSCPRLGGTCWRGAPTEPGVERENGAEIRRLKRLHVVSLLLVGTGAAGLVSFYAAALVVGGMLWWDLR